MTKQKTHQSQRYLDFMRDPVPADEKGKRNGVVAYDINGSQSWEALGPAARLLKMEKMDFRSYEFSIAKTIFEGKNTLVIMPTSSGKTILELLSAANAINNGKKAIFVAATKALVSQHYEETAMDLFRDNSGISMLVGTVDKEKRAEIWKKSSLIIATPETAVNDKAAGRLNLKDFGVLIIDESQRTRGNYAYTKLANMFNEQNIQVVSFTATLSSLKQTAGTIVMALKPENVEVRDYKVDKDIAPYKKTTNVSRIDVEKSAKMLEIEGAFRKLIKQNLGAMGSAGLIKGEDSDVSFNFGALEGQGSAQIEEFERMPRLKFLSLKADADKLMGEVRGLIGRAKNDASLQQEIDTKIKGVKGFTKLKYIAHAYDTFQTQGFKPTLDYIDGLKAEQLARRAAGKPTSKSLDELLKTNTASQGVSTLLKEAIDSGQEHPKVAALIDLVKNNHNEKIMIFANCRSTVDMLVGKLKTQNLDARPFIGQRGGMTSKMQRATMEEFSNSKFSPIVSTCIGEEGMDFKGAEPTFVICYDAVPSGIRTKQREGRTGRHMPGRVVTLVTKGTKEEEFYGIASWRKKNISDITDKLRRGEIGPIVHQPNSKTNSKASHTSQNNTQNRIPTLTGEQGVLINIRKHYDPG